MGAVLRWNAGVSVHVSTKATCVHSIHACTKAAKLASLQVYLPLHPGLPWLLTMVTICITAADFGR